MDSEDWADDVGIDGAGASAEEAAMHVVDGDGPGVLTEWARVGPPSHSSEKMAA